MERRSSTFVYHPAKSTSFLIPIAICLAPSIRASGLSVFGSGFLIDLTEIMQDCSLMVYLECTYLAHAAGAADDSALRAMKSISVILTSGDSRLCRNATMSFPCKKMVESEAEACTAKVSVEETSDASNTVCIFVKASRVRVRGETTKIAVGISVGALNESQNEYSRASLSTPKKEVRRSSGARRRSLRLSFFARAAELVSVSSLAITTTGTGDEFFAVLGLKTRVLMSLNEYGRKLSDAVSASFQAAGDEVALCLTSPLCGMRSADSREITSATDMVEIARTTAKGGWRNDIRRSSRSSREYPQRDIRM